MNKQDPFNQFDETFNKAHKRTFIAIICFWFVCVILSLAASGGLIALAVWAVKQFTK